jgi:hypothetical protein
VGNEPGGTLPLPDYADIRPDDTRLSWLQRTDPTHGWHTDPFTGALLGYLNPGPPPSGANLVCLFSEAEFAVWRATYTPRTAPVWPGAANVEWGTPVALAQSVEIAEDCDGLLIDIQSMERLIPYMTVYDWRMYRNLGRCLFTAEGGGAESWQGIPANLCLMSPRSLARATSAYLAFYTGVTGTVTPWRIKRPS